MRGTKSGVTTRVLADLARMHAIHVPVIPVCETSTIISGYEAYTCNEVQFVHKKKRSWEVCFVLAEAFLFTASEQVSSAVVRVKLNPCSMK